MSSAAESTRRAIFEPITCKYCQQKMYELAQGIYLCKVDKALRVNTLVSATWYREEGEEGDNNR